METGQLQLDVIAAAVHNICLKMWDQVKKTFFLENIA